VETASGVDVFISYSSHDKTVADATCSTLESAGIRCWIAPRDVLPGKEYAAAIIQAIDSCRTLVLIFSSHANASPQIHREIERAASKNATIIPMRIEDIKPTEGMEYFLGQIHWLDAFTPPLAVHLQQLVETIKSIQQPSSARLSLVLPDKPSIAVLPFQNIGGNPEQEYFADGIVEDIITALSRFPQLFVIARNSSFAYKGQHLDIRQIGRELGVQYVLEGSVRRSQDHMRVTTQLIDAKSGSHIWADSYDRVVAAVFDVQDEIMRATVGAIEPSVKRAEIERAKRKRANQLGAYDLYLRALPGLYSATRQGNEEAVRLLKQSLSVDPNFAASAAMLGLCFTWQFAYGWGNLQEIVSEALHYAQMALRLDKDNSDALAIMARLTGGPRHQYDEAMILAERAVECNPNSAFAWNNRGWIHLFMEQPEIAKPYLEYALRLSPRDPFSHDTWVGIAIVFIQLKRDEDAVIAARKAVQQNPQHAWSHRLLAISLALAGRREEACSAVKRAMEVDPTFSIKGFRSWNPFLHGNKRYVDGMELAGFPEEQAA
jgi:adenylate cyclase